MSGYPDPNTTLKNGYVKSVSSHPPHDILKNSEESKPQELNRTRNGKTNAQILLNTC
jgi:hypothetical protein